MDGCSSCCGRRDFLRLGLGAVGAEALAGCFSCDGRLGAVSRFRGIQLGAITYSFRSMPTRERDALATLDYCRESGVGSVELMGRTVEAFLELPTPQGNDPLAFVRRFHDRIVSVHLKDRTTKAHGQKNLPWGEGETPLGPLFDLMLREGYDFHADAELEYRIPNGSNAVLEVGKCIRYAERLIG